MNLLFFCPGFIHDGKDVRLIGEILAEVAPKFEKAGWKIHLPSFCNLPSYWPIESYAEILADEIVDLSPDAVAGLSMGVLTLRKSCEILKDDFPDVPVVLMEGPNWGVSWWQLLIISTKYSPMRPCIRDLWRRSAFLKDLNDNCFNGNPVLEVHGKFSEMRLAKDVFAKLPYTHLEEFPDVGHRELVTEERVVRTVIDFLNFNAGRR